MKKKVNTTIFLVRHGKTHKGREIFWSRKPGRSLNKIGRKQIEKVAIYLSQFPVRQIFHSPSKRTTQSAEIIKKYFSPAKILASKNLWEWDQGFNGQKVEGKSFAFFGSEINEMYQKHPTEMIGGETLNATVTRAVEFINELSSHYQGKFVVCVSHEDVIRAVVLALQKESLDRLNTIPCAKGSIYQLVFKDHRFVSATYYGD